MAYNDWRMEAEQTYMDFALDAANMLKENLSSGIADAIVNGNKLSDVFKNTGKQIAQMFIQWQISRLMADVLSDKLRTKEIVKTKRWQPVWCCRCIKSLSQRSGRSLGR